MGKDDVKLIIETLLNLVFKIFSAVIEPLDIEPAPDELINAMDSFIGYLANGAELINIFLPIKLGPYFVVFFVIFAFSHLYPFIMWILRKIPFLGIE